MLAKLASQFLLIDAAPAAKEFRPQGLDLTRSLRAWRELIYRIVEACHRAGGMLVQSSPEAGQLLMEFWRQNMGEGGWLTPEAKAFQRNAALVAAKMALVFHLVLVGPKQRVSAEIMEHAIGMAQRLTRSTAATIDHLVQEAREASLHREAEDMLQRIGQESPLRWRLLRRTYHLHDIALHQPALDLLLATGQAAYDDRRRIVPANGASDPII
jgi:hypothetical protein